MHVSRDYQNRGLRRRSGIVAGLGTVAGGMLVAGLAQLGAAPHANADGIENSITDTLAAANVDFGDAASAFNAGDVSDGLAYGFAGVNDDTLALAGDVVYNAYAELSGVSGPGTFFDYPELPAPTDLTAAATDVTQVLGIADSFFTAASGEFLSGDFVDGAANAFAGLGNLVDVPEVEFIGLLGGV
jgi:hypothetical protein